MRLRGAQCPKGNPRKSCGQALSARSVSDRTRRGFAHRLFPMFYRSLRKNCCRSGDRLEEAGALRHRHYLGCYRLRIVLLVLLHHTGVNLNVQRLSNAPTVIHISPEEVAQLPHLDILPCSTQRSCDCLRCTILLIFRECGGATLTELRGLGNVL